MQRQWTPIKEYSDILFEYFEGNWDKEEIYDDIDAGWYSLNGNTIKKIKDSDIINE